MKKASKWHFFRAEFAEFLQKVGKKAEKWRFYEKNSDFSGLVPAKVEGERCYLTIDEKQLDLFADSA